MNKFPKELIHLRNNFIHFFKKTFIAKDALNEASTTHFPLDEIQIF